MVVAKKSAYEESRQKRLEENKKRMEELNLNKLAQALRTPKPSPVCQISKKGSFSFFILNTIFEYVYVFKYFKQEFKWFLLLLLFFLMFVCDFFVFLFYPQMKKVKPKVPKQPLDLSAVRRSSRVADLPPRTYKEVCN